MNGKERRTILVVDDVPDNIAVLVEFLKEEYRAKTASNGEAALEIAQSDSPPDLMLLDVMMPGMDGLEVCRRLKHDKVASRIPVIFVTSKDDVSDEAMGFEVGAADYIVKPVKPALVRARVKTHLELKIARQGLENQNEILQENARLREEVEAISRHDLKNPLMIVMTVPGVLLAQASLTDSHKKLLRMVDDAGRRMLEMINSTIDLYKMEKGTYVLKPTPADVLQVIEQNIAAVRGLMDEKSLAYEVTVRGKPIGIGDSFLAKGEDLLVYSLLPISSRTLPKPLRGRHRSRFPLANGKSDDSHPQHGCNPRENTRTVLREVRNGGQGPRDRPRCIFCKAHRAHTRRHYWFRDI